jgi:hypothetical protein
VNISNIVATRVITHEVVRAQELENRAPVLSDVLISLDASGNGLIAKRLTDTLSTGSHCVEVTVEDASNGSPFCYASSMLDATDEEFISHSTHLAQALSQAQTSGSIKAGSAVFIQGTCITDEQNVRFITIIKADSDQALQKQINGENITLTYVNDMILGQSQKLFKVAFFVEQVRQQESRDCRSTEDFEIQVFDHMMNNSGNGTAATYFYSTFLKCKQADNASRQTKQFYEETKRFIEAMQIDAGEKLELKGGLISYMRGNRTILEPNEFAREFLPEDHQDRFVNQCRNSGINGAVSKDLTLLKGKMRRQSVKFSSNVTLYASPDVFKESVKVGEFNDGWTEIKILGQLENIS